jgi:diacylglycerol O-acyltransferase
LRNDLRRVGTSLGTRGRRRAVRPTRLNRGPSGTRRRIDWLPVPLADMQATKAAFGTTIHTVVLAAAAGALRRYFARHGELPDELFTQVSVARRRDEKLQHPKLQQLGTRATAIYPKLPLAEVDPARRVRLVIESVAHERAAARAPFGRLTALFALAPPIALSYAMRRHFRRRCNLPVGNSLRLPGPLYCCGRRLELSLPSPPVIPAHGVSIEVHSYLETFVFGITADRDRVPDSELLAEDLRSSIEELRALALDPAAR